MAAISVHIDLAVNPMLLSSLQRTFRFQLTYTLHKRLNLLGLTIAFSAHRNQLCDQIFAGVVVRKIALLRMNRLGVLVFAHCMLPSIRAPATGVKAGAVAGRQIGHGTISAETRALKR